MTTMSENEPRIGAQAVKALRERTGAGMMDCKNALTEAGGDAARAEEILRVKLGKKVGKLEGRDAFEGTIQAYIHQTGRVGVIVEVDCNTDFVAGNEEFVAFARDVALQIAATPTVAYVSREDVPAAAREAEERIYEQEAADKPEKVRPRIVEGKLSSWYETVALLETKLHNPKFEGKSVKQVRDELAGKTGENIVIRRFVRWEVGK